MRQYPLYCDGAEIGVVCVAREGMYCRITCVSSTEQAGERSVIATIRDGSHNLGKFAKEANRYVLRRFIPAKMLGTGEPRFSIKDVGREEAVMILLEPDKPFAEIAQLRYARFISNASRAGIVIDRKSV